MPTTRRQEAIQAGKIKEEPPKLAQSPRRGGSRSRTRSPSKHTRKRQHEVEEEEEPVKANPRGKGPKRSRVAQDDIEQKPATRSRPAVVNRRASSVPPPKVKGDSADSEERKDVYQAGTIERGHIYFFYRPKVEVEEAHSIDEVKNLHMLLIPRPPEFATFTADSGSNKASKPDPTRTEEAEMKVLAPGADAVPAPVTRNTSKQFYRLITIGKKKLPDPRHGKGKGRPDTFWGTVTSLGEDLHNLVEGLGPKTYETKTRGTRHESAARLVARGGYAIVNTDAHTPSQRETHLGYNISHPSPDDRGDVQATFGIYSSSSFVVQVKNPKAPNTAPGMAHAKEAQYPDWVMKDIFGSGSAKGGRGREAYGLRFASVETPELLDYEGAQLLLIAARDGEQGLETSLGEGRGEGLPSDSPMQIILPELLDQHVRAQRIRKLIVE